MAEPKDPANDTLDDLFKGCLPVVLIFIAIFIGVIAWEIFK